ncbi:MAG: redoxin domain-containing protein [Phycisphaerales bacterium]|nr:redoxin domain-containing protein [Phycisphaerales bacterium]
MMCCKMSVLALTGAAVLVGFGVASMTVNAEPAAAKPAPKAEAKGAKLGESAPAFALKDTAGKEHSLAAYTKEGKVVVLEWFNSGCPFVVKHLEAKTVNSLVEKYKDKVVFLGINSTNSGHKDFGKDKDAIEKYKLNYPILLDTDGTVGRAYGARVTPHIFIVDASGKLVYNGAIDNDPKGDLESGKVVNFVDKALTEVLGGKAVTNAENRAYGCSVKYAGK